MNRFQSKYYFCVIVGFFLILAFTKYLNGKLDENTDYAVFQRSFDKNGDYENEGFSTFTTMKVEVEVPTVPVVLSVVVGLLLEIIVVGAIILWRRFHHNGTFSIIIKKLTLQLINANFRVLNKRVTLLF